MNFTVERKWERMLKFKNSLRVLFMLGAMALGAAPARAEFVSYVIRNSAGPVAPQINTVPQGVEFVISAGGQKAGYGSNDINGARVDEILNLKITRYDGQFAGGGGPAFAPYFNIWVTDGLGQFAVIANEPTNPDFQPLFTDNGNGSKSYDLSFADLADKSLKVYETQNGGTNNTWVHTMFGGGSLTFAKVASLTIAAPDASYITNPANFVGGGAPRELGTNLAYGFNWIFGDTLANYVSGQPGYIVGDVAAVATPEPTSAVLLGLGAAGFAAVRRRRKAAKV